jgi:hypothetical protein
MSAWHSSSATHAFICAARLVMAQLIFAEPLLCILLVPLLVQLLQHLQEVVEEVYGLLQERNSDWQQLRTWVRQLQQAQQEQQQQQQPQSQEQLNDSSSDSEGGGWGVAAGSSQTPAIAAAGDATVQQLAVHDFEVQQLMLELAEKQPAKQGKAAKGQGKSPSALARRSIRNMLKPLAIALRAE